MAERTLVVEELIGLYDEIPALALYKNDLFTVERTDLIARIPVATNDSSLNPLDVVLESLINILSEKVSIDTLIESKSLVYVDKSVQEQAVQRVISLLKDDMFFLKEMHKRWLKELHTLIAKLVDDGAQTIQEIVFQVGLRFRISALSSLKAIDSLLREYP